jgi:hypothetical protein
MPLLLLLRCVCVSVCLCYVCARISMDTCNMRSRQQDERRGGGGACKAIRHFGKRGLSLEIYSSSSSSLPPCPPPPLSQAAAAETKRLESVIKKLSVGEKSEAVKAEKEIEERK